MGTERQGSSLSEIGPDFIQDRGLIVKYVEALRFQLDDDIAHPEAAIENPHLVGILNALEWVVGERNHLIDRETTVEGKVVDQSVK